MRSTLSLLVMCSCEVLSMYLRALQADEGLKKVGPKHPLQKRQELSYRASKIHLSQKSLGIFARQQSRFRMTIWSNPTCRFHNFDFPDM
jgi:hypothetical protein